jgi:hypothetical protein
MEAAERIETVELIAPPNVHGAGTPWGQVTVKDGRAEAPAAAVEDLLKMGFKRVPPRPLSEREIGKLRERHETLRKRKESLDAERSQIDARLKAIEQEISDKRVELAEGRTTVQALAKLSAAHAEHAMTIEHVTAAAATVKADLEAAFRELQLQEGIREADRQRKAAEPLLAQAEGADRRFAQELVGAIRGLAELSDLALRVSQEFPAVGPIPALTLSRLTDAAMAELKAGNPFPGPVDRGLLERWIVAVLQGPDQGIVRINMAAAAGALARLHTRL